MYQVVCVAVLLMAVAGIHTSHAYGGNLDTGRAPLCPSYNKPCRIRVSVGDIGGAEIQSHGAATCTCSRPAVCTDDWNDALRVVSRKVISNTFNITLQMKFCQTVVPVRFCRRREISIVLKGSTMMPLDIVSYNCRCRRRKPLVLYSRTFGEDYMTYNSYKCENHLAECPVSAPCFTSSSDFSSRYPCRCPQGLQCREGGRTAYCGP